MIKEGTTAYKRLQSEIASGSALAQTRVAMVELKKGLTDLSISTDESRRAMVNILAEHQKHSREMAELAERLERMERIYSAIIRGEIGHTVEEEGVTYSFETDEGYAALVADLRKEKDTLRRMKTCVRVVGEFKTSMSSWENKISKMQERLGRPGSTAAENAVAERKIIAFKEVVEVLGKRRGEIVKIYNDSKALVAKEVAKLNDQMDMNNE